MWTEDHKRSDANHIACINLIQSKTTHCAKLMLMKVQESYIDTSRGKNTVKRNSKRRIPRMSSENRRLFTGVNLVVRPA